MRVERLDRGGGAEPAHSDKGRAPNERGSQLRRVEKAKAASGRPYTMSVVLDPIPAIVSAVTQKVGRATHADRQRFRKLILLIASSLPHGGPAATFLLDAVLDLPRLNAETHELLSRSGYNSAYIFNVLSLQGTPVVYQWDRESDWRRSGPAPPDEAHGRPAAEAEDVGLQTIRFLQSLGGPQPGPGSLSDGLGPNFFPELLEAFSDREPRPDEIAAFERSFRERYRT